MFSFSDVSLIFYDHCTLPAKMIPQSSKPYTVGFVLLPQFSLMAFASASEPLRAANRLSGDRLYDWLLVSEEGEPVCSSNGMVSMVHSSLDKAPEMDMVVVVASFAPERATTSKLLGWLRRQAQRGILLGGVDTGSYALARAGLLDGYEATVHWEYLETFQQQFPRVSVTQAMFNRSRRRFSAAGGTACLDMMLHLVRAQHGHSLATAVSDQFIYGRIRSGEDQQRMALIERLAVKQPHLIQAVMLMEEHLEDTLSTVQIARAVGMSVRELERLFRRWLQTTPGAYYRRQRLDKGRALLQQSALSVTEIAGLCGFGSVASFSRAYKTRFGLPPSAGR
jgi:AraC family carnitine catabolism transcriptional activator